MDNQAALPYIRKIGGRGGGGSNDRNKEKIVAISNREYNHNYCRMSPSKAQYSSGKRQQRIKIKSQDISETVLCKGLSRNRSICHQCDNSVPSVLFLKNMTWFREQMHLNKVGRT